MAGTSFLAAGFLALVAAAFFGAAAFGLAATFLVAAAFGLAAVFGAAAFLVVAAFLAGAAFAFGFATAGLAAGFGSFLASLVPPDDPEGKSVELIGESI